MSLTLFIITAMELIADAIAADGIPATLKAIRAGAGRKTIALIFGITTAALAIAVGTALLAFRLWGWMSMQMIIPAMILGTTFAVNAQRKHAPNRSR